MFYSSFSKMSAWECRSRGLWGGLSRPVMGGSPISVHFVSKETGRMEGVGREVRIRRFQHRIRILDHCG